MTWPTWSLHTERAALQEIRNIDSGCTIGSAVRFLSYHHRQ